MASLQKDPKHKRWRIRYREGGRGSPLKPTPWIYDKGEALEAKAAIEARLAARKPAGAFVSLVEAKARYVLHQEGRKRRPRYLEEIANAFRRQLKDITKLAELTTAKLDAMAIGDRRIIRAFLHYCEGELEMQVDRKQLRAPITPPRRPGKELLDDATALGLIARALAWPGANGVIAHLVGWYGHRAESLVELEVQAVTLSFVAPTDAATYDAIGPGWSTITMRVKSGDIHSHPIRMETAELLVPHVVGRKPGDRLFLNHNGEPWKNGVTYAYWFRNCIGGKGIGYYRLKDWAVTRWRSLVDDATGMAITGHRTRSAYQGYERTNTQRKIAAISAIHPPRVTSV